MKSGWTLVRMTQLIIGCIIFAIVFWGTKYAHLSYAIALFGISIMPADENELK